MVKCTLDMLHNFPSNLLLFVRSYTAHVTRPVHSATWSYIKSQHFKFTVISNNYHKQKVVSLLQKISFLKVVH